MSTVAFHQGPTGAAKVDGALSAGATTLAIKVTTGTLVGTVLTGATFTAAGEAGLPTHTVTNGPLVCALNALAGVAFTPAIAAGGVADGAALTFTAATTVNGILEQDAALLTDEFRAEAVYHMPWLTLATAQITALVIGDQVFVDGATVYTVRDKHTPADGALAHVLLASPA